MSHLDEQQMVEMLFGECHGIRAWLRRRHLQKCDACRERYEALCQDQEEQRAIGRQLKEYGECLKEAEKTMTLPKPPAAG